MTSDLQALVNQARTLTASNSPKPKENTPSVVNIRPTVRQEIADAEKTQGIERSAAPQQDAKDSKAIIEQTVNSLNENNFNVKRSLRFEVDDQTGVTVITVKDTSTQEIIRQIPSEELLKLAQHIQSLTEEFSESKGFLVSTEA